MIKINQGKLNEQMIFGDKLNVNQPLRHGQDCEKTKKKENRACGVNKFFIHNLKQCFPLIRFYK